MMLDNDDANDVCDNPCNQSIAEHVNYRLGHLALVGNQAGKRKFLHQILRLGHGQNPTTSRKHNTPNPEPSFQSVLNPEGYS